MTKSILERLSSKDKSSKTEFEEKLDYILSSMGIRISDMRAFVDIYSECEMKDRMKISDTVLWQVIGKLDEIEEIYNMLDQLNSGKATADTGSSLIHLNYENMYNYDDAIEEIHSEILE